MRRHEGFPVRAAAMLVTAFLLSAGAMGVLRAQAPPAGAPKHEDQTSGVILESEDAQKVTRVIQCFCGTCSNQTLHDCTCGVATSERRKVAAALAEGKTPDELIAAYIVQHGPQVRIVPEKAGLNLVGWAVPFAASLLGLIALVFVLRGWQRHAEAAPAAAPSAAPGPADGQYQAMLERDLKDMD